MHWNHAREMIVSVLMQYYDLLNRINGAESARLSIFSWLNRALQRTEFPMWVNKNILIHEREAGDQLLSKKQESNPAHDGDSLRINCTTPMTEGWNTLYYQN